MIVVVVALAAVGGITAMLYGNAIKGQQARSVAMVQSHADGSPLPRLEDSDTAFLSGHRDVAVPEVVPFDSGLKAPTWPTTLGRPGSIAGLDASGGEVVAADELVEKAPGMAVEADTGEVPMPFVSAGLAAAGAAFVVILAGSLLLVRVSNPLVRRLRAYSAQLEEMVAARSRELEKAQEQLVRSEKLAVLGQLAGGVGHELRNPLGAIKNAAYFLNMALEEPDPEVQETLDILDREVASAESIISSLLDYAGAKPPVRRTVVVNDVLHSVLCGVDVPANVSVVVRMEEALPAIQADSDQLGQVFRNIVANAVQAMPQGGRLVVHARAVGRDWVAVSFTDTGDGIAEDDIEKVFEPLFTGKAKGIGLGLSICRSLVEAHGGTIEVESELGKGSTFTVKVPVGGKEA